MNRSHLLFTVWYLAALTVAGKADAYNWNIIALPTLGGASSRGEGMNNFGHVVGSAKTADGATHAFLFKDGAMQDLYTLDGGGSSWAFGINDVGQVVGTGTTAQGDAHAFLYEQGKKRDLGILPGGKHSEARAINNAGKTVGSAYLPTVTNQPQYEVHVDRSVLFDQGQVHDLGTLSSEERSYSSARDINNSGQIVGISQVDGDGYQHAYLYDQGVMHDLGSLYGGFSHAYAVNDAGQVVGNSNYTTPFGTGTMYTAHAFLYDSGAMIDLGTLGGYGSHAIDINSAGDIVGSAQDSTGTSRAFLYQNGVMTDLNSLISLGSDSWLTRSIAINNRGDILASDNHGRTLLLSAIPEPESSAMLAAGLGLTTLLAARRRRKSSAWQ